MSQDMVKKPNKHLRYSEEHFQGYFVQLNTLLRKDGDTDELLDGFLVNPLLTLCESINPNDDTCPNKAVAESIRTLYIKHMLGDPPGTFPPPAGVIIKDPMQCIKDLNQATDRGKTFGPDTVAKKS